MGKSYGVIIDILNEMSKKLNFTYELHLAQASTSMNSTDDMNGTVRILQLIKSQIDSKIFKSHR